MLKISQHDRHVEISYYWPDVELSQGVQNVGCATQISDKLSGKSYHPPSAISQKLTVQFYAWHAAVWKANGYLPRRD